jgi:GntR family transcriptional regulator/MocR family aminotransferase
MVKYSSSIPNGLITLDTKSETPLYRQLYNCLRKAILTGQLAPGTRLQSSREISKELGISRNTVVNAFEQLPKAIWRAKSAQARMSRVQPSQGVGKARARRRQRFKA